jgi:hypothetical protein
VVDTEQPTITLDMEVDGACDVNQAALECRNLVIANPLVPLFASLPERRYPLVLRVPIERRTEVEIVPPSGWSLADRAPRRLETAWGDVSETIDPSGRSSLRVSLPKQTVSTEDYPAFARFCRAVDELTSRPPMLVRPR